MNITREEAIRILRETLGGEEESVNRPARRRRRCRGAGRGRLSEAVHYDDVDLGEASDDIVEGADAYYAGKDQMRAVALSVKRQLSTVFETALKDAEKAVEDFEEAGNAFVRASKLLDRSGDPDLEGRITPKFMNAFEKMHEVAEFINEGLDGLEDELGDFLKSAERRLRDYEKASDDAEREIRNFLG